MRITKLGHCCLLINIGSLMILTDPGNFSDAQNTLTGIDIVLITHEHADHFHIDSVKALLEHNPHMKIITNSGVAQKIDEAGIGATYQILEGRNIAQLGNIQIEAFDHKHEEIYEEIGQVQNTGYLINNYFFYPGDSFCVPKSSDGSHISINTLALPVAGGWCKNGDAIRYALEVRPKIAIPVHDGMLQDNRFGSVHKAPEQILKKNDINFKPLIAGESVEV